jgi:hypothetical protein
MIRELRRRTTSLVALILAGGSCAWSLAAADEATLQLSLADLAAYRAALAGKPTADLARSSDPPAPLAFRELWDRRDSWRGRRVKIEGRAQRTFRQGPIGSFPPLVEAWITSPAGDPFCLVFPQVNDTGISTGDHPGLEISAPSKRVPELGQDVQFTGTFLRMVRYTAGDGARLAPLIVGDRPPVSTRESPSARSTSRAFGTVDAGSLAGSPVNWLACLVLGLVAAGMLAWRQVHVPAHASRLRHPRRRSAARLAADPPLEFIEPLTKCQ